MSKSKIITYMSIFGLITGFFLLSGEDTSAMQKHAHHGHSQIHMMHGVHGQVHAHSHHGHRQIHMMHGVHGQVHAHSHY